MGKEERIGFLEKLLKKEDLGSQEEVVEAMKKAGYQVTQSSISRDFRGLGVIKVGGRYVLKSDLTKDARKKTLQQMIIGIDTAGPNLIIVECYTGCANAVAQALDEKNIPEIVGTVSGDNTFFVATKSGSSQAKVIRELQELE